MKPSKVDTIGTTAACLEYEGICNLGASGILLVGVALYTWAVEHDVTTLPDLSPLLYNSEKGYFDQ